MESQVAGGECGREGLAAFLVRAGVFLAGLAVGAGRIRRAEDCQLNLGR
jgi:hypothetical protein